MDRLENESILSKLLTVKITYAHGSKFDFEEVLPLISEEKHPILHLFASINSK
jgi:hypothetical protein